MDRLTQLRGEAGSSKDSSLANSPQSDAYMSADDSSKYFSLTEEESTYDISPIKDVSLASTADQEKTITGTDQLMPNLSPIPKKSDLLDSFKFGKEIEAANILSGGVNIFEDNDNSYDGDELVIDDNVEIDDKSNPEMKLADSGLPFQKGEEVSETMDNETAIASKDTEVVLQIDGKNVNAIDIGNGLYLYRKEGEEELAAVQIIDDEQQPSFKFLKVRENAEGNLEVYEEIEIEVPKEVPVKEGKTVSKSAPYVPIKHINEVVSNQTCVHTDIERKIKTPQGDIPSTSTSESVADSTNNSQPDIESDVNLNGKMVKFNETRKSPVIHSTPNKEGIPLTKTMVDLHLHPTRHSDKVKTIEVHTDNCKQKSVDTNTKTKELHDENKISDIVLIDPDKKECKDKTKHASEANSVENKNLEGSPDNKKKDDQSIDKKIQFAEVESTSSNNNFPITSTSLKLPSEVVENIEKETSEMESNSELSSLRLVQSRDSTENTKEDDKLKINHTEMIIKPTQNLDSNESKEINPTITHNSKDAADYTDKKLKSNLEKDQDKDGKDKQTYKNSKDEAMSTVKTDVSQTVHKFINLFENRIHSESVQNKIAEETSNKRTIDLNNELVEAINDNQISLSAQKPQIEGISSSSSDIKIHDNKDVQAEKNNPKKDEKEKDPESTKEEYKINIGHENSKIKPEKTTTKDEATSVGKESKVINIIGISKEVSTKITKDENNSNENISKDPLNVLNISHVEVKTKIPTVNKHENTHAKQPVSQDLKTNNAINPMEYGVKAEKNKDIMTYAKVENSIKRQIEPSKAIESFPKTTQNKNELKKELPTAKSAHKATNNNDTAVPFGKWTEANRQDFLNKIKETKVPTSSSNTKQLKQANDLNRRDVLKKIDSQRQSSNALAKVQELHASQMLNVKSESKNFAVKPTIVHPESKLPVKTYVPTLKNKPIPVTQKITKQEVPEKPQIDQPISTSVMNKKDCMQRKEINNQDLIDKTIEDIINRAPAVKPNQEDTKQTSKDSVTNQNDTNTQPKVSQPKGKPHISLDPIEMKMNELHGIPFVERPPHELPQIYNQDLKSYPKTENQKPGSLKSENQKTGSTKPENQKTGSNKTTKIPNLLPFPNKSEQKMLKDNVVDIDSEEEVIEHEPITGDIELNNKKGLSKAPATDNVMKTAVAHVIVDAPKKEAIITEKDFDKFVRRNSITYENCLNFEGKEPHNVIQTVVEKDIPVKKYSRNEILLAEAKVKASQKHQSHSNKNSNKIQITSKVIPIPVDDMYNKNYQSKLQLAYQSALTAKRRMEAPITIIEDKPVKVVFMDSNTEFIPQLNVQGHDLSPIKKVIADSDAITASCDSLDSVIETTDDSKSQDENKFKTKHQRKQVLTPVDTPDLELVEPADIGIHDSPKKKRKTEDNKFDKTTKNLVPKKSYLLGRSNIVDDVEKANLGAEKSLHKDPISQINPVSHNDAASAIDNLVKAAELIETQSETFNVSAVSASSDNSQQSTPLKRGRGRPRKYPLPDGAADKNKVQSPQKSPRLFDQKKVKTYSSTDEDMSDSDMIRENWTMGKINENILCPICNKLFRSENVVFKHVKHCTGPSPNRSDSDKRSTRRSRPSLESESKSRDSQSEEDLNIDSEKNAPIKNTPKKRRFKSESSPEKDDVFLIEDVPLKKRIEKRDEPKLHESKKVDPKTKISLRTNSLACKFCGKSFRQLTYLVSHKLQQHKKEESPKINEGAEINPARSIYSCEVCKKVFRKLHHLVQHRIIHNPSSMPSKSTRKSSSEQSESKTTKDQDSSKQSEDQSAAFRCEPCDKSFRKLHHLVEHRETHQGINKQKSVSTSIINAEKPIPAPSTRCDVCKKTFRKLHHLIEHKEQHHETSSEKSDDKSVKSSLSTKDIIHECSLCYMVFPNEHSLNKHSVICLKKKKQSIAKQAKQLEETEEVGDNTDNVAPLESEIVIDDLKPVTEDNLNLEQNMQSEVQLLSPIVEKNEDVPNITEKPLEKEIKVDELKTVSNKRDIENIVNTESKTQESASEISAKIKKIEEKVKDDNFKKKLDTPKKKTPLKNKVNPIKAKNQKSTLPLSIANEEIARNDSNDDDEVRYMLNPDFIVDEEKVFMKVRAKKRSSLKFEQPSSKDFPDCIVDEEKVFMKVRAKKHSSLKFEQPSSKDLVKRRTSILHPQQISRLKSKPVETKATNPVQFPKSYGNISYTQIESVPSTDSDDSDVKYSFPKDIEEKPSNSKTKEVEKTPKGRKKSLVDKSLTGIAKRKALGNVIIKYNEKSTQVKQIKRRTTEVEHRCDCGQLFSSAALLSRHTTLAHTPPRIRRRRSQNISVNVIKPPPRKSSVTENPKITTSRKSSVKSETSVSAKPVLSSKSSVTEKPKITTSRKSSVKSETSVSAKPVLSSRKSTNKSEVKTLNRKSVQPVEKMEVTTGKTIVKSRRSIAHRDVPVPEKIRKLTEKARK